MGHRAHYLAAMPLVAAVSIVSKKPTGEFGIRQSIGMGRFDELRSVTRINFDEVAGVRAKLDYLHSERDGWVDNTAPRRGGLQPV